MMELLVACTITACLVLGALLRYMPFAAAVEPNQKRTLTVVYTALSVVFLVCMTVEMYLEGLLSCFDYLRYGGILYAAILTLVNIFVIRGRVREHLFVFGIVLNCTYLLLSVPNYLISVMGWLSTEQSVCVVIGSYGVLMLLSYWPLNKLLSTAITPFLYMENAKLWRTVWFIPIVFFGARYSSLGGDHDSGNLVQLAGSVLTAVVMIFLCLRIAADHGRLQEQKLMEVQLAAQKLHYNELRVKVEEARKAKHDFKHHVAVIRHYIDMDDKEGLHQYCDELISREDTEGTIPYTGNAAADGVIYHFMQRSRQNQIHFDFSGSIRTPGIADIDLCALLGNALDNALTGCMTLPEGRSITMVSQSEQKLLSVVIRNTFDGKVDQSGDALLSRKRENRPGIGISSMESICKRYGGSFEMQWDDSYFTVMILLPLEQT